MSLHEHEKFNYRNLEDLKLKIEQLGLNIGLNEDISILKAPLRIGQFVIPNRFKKNTEKTTYKVGFLSEFLSEVYPMKNYNDICAILNFRYHIFLGRRQIERLTRAYNSNEIYLNW